MKDADGVLLSPTYSTAKMDNYNGMLKLGYDINENQRVKLLISDILQDQTLM
jgi:iron complex outermembrane receptor protein